MIVLDVGRYDVLALLPLDLLYLKFGRECTLLRSTLSDLIRVERDISFWETFVRGNISKRRHF